MPENASLGNVDSQLCTEPVVAVTVVQRHGPGPVVRGGEAVHSNDVDGGFAKILQSVTSVASSTRRVGLFLLVEPSLSARHVQLEDEVLGSGWVKVFGVGEERGFPDRSCVVDAMVRSRAWASDYGTSWDARALSWIITIHDCG